MLGAPGWTRTTDLRLRSPLLYPAELPGQKYPVDISVAANEVSVKTNLTVCASHKCDTTRVL
jgi:hypothetical protein